MNTNPASTDEFYPRSLDEVCDRFEAAWRSGPAPPSMAEFVESVEEPPRCALLRELVAIDLAFRWGATQGLSAGRAAAADPPWRLEDYLARFPELHGAFDAELLWEEYRARSDAGHSPDLAEYRSRFPQLAAELAEMHRELSTQAHGHQAITDGVRVRCTHCFHTTITPNGNPLSTARCANCGREFAAPGTACGSPVEGSAMVGPFRLIEQIGQGGHGVVWKAQDTRLGRIVALKIPGAGCMTDDELERFFREARAAAKLNHPNIVSVYEVGQAGTVAYIASDFIDGATLAERLSTNPPSVTEAAQIAAVVADALAHAHEHGVIHRDVKPSNVLLDAAGQPYVTDFGLARHDAEITISLDGKIIGTPAYMSPEQVRARGDIDHRVDVYALGVVLFQMATGRLPFQGTAGSTLDQVIHAPPPSPRNLSPRIPRDLETISLKCMEKRPESRYQSARQLAEDLRAFLERRPIQARPISSYARCWRWIGRHRVATVAIFLATLLVIVAALAAWNQQRLSKNARIANRRAIQAGETAQRDRYHHDLVRASAVLSDGRPNAALDWLELCLPRLRHWEWRRLHAACRNQWVRTLAESPAPLWCLSVDRNDEQVAAGAADGGLRAWNRHGQLAFEVPAAHEGRVWCVAYTSDGSRLATGGSDGAIKIWDSRTGALVQILSGHRRQVNSLAFHPDGQRLISASADSSLRFWHLGRGETVRELPHDVPVWALCLSPDGRFLASGDASGAVRLWELATNRARWSSANETSAITDIEFSPTGDQLATSNTGHTIRVWRVETGQELVSFAGHTNRVNSVAWHPQNGTLASVSSDHTLRVWDADQKRLVRIVRGHHGAVWSVAAVPDGSSFITASDDRTIRRWSAERTEADLIVDTEFERPRTIVFNSDCKLLAVADAGGAVKLWETSSGKLLGSNSGRAVDGQNLLPEEAALVTAAGERSGRDSSAELETLGVRPELLDFAASARSVAISPDGNAIAVAGTDGVARVWSVRTGKVTLTLPGRGRSVTAVAFSPDGQRLFTGSADDTIEVWDAVSGRDLLTLRGHAAEITGLAMSPDGEVLASVAADGRLILWKAADVDEPAEEAPQSADHPLP